MIQSEFQPMSLKLRFYARNGVTLITMIFGWQVFLLYKTQIMVKIVFHTNHKWSCLLIVIRVTMSRLYLSKCEEMSHEMPTPKPHV